MMLPELLQEEVVTVVTVVVTHNLRSTSLAPNIKNQIIPILRICAVCTLQKQRRFSEINMCMKSYWIRVKSCTQYLHINIIY